MTKKQQRFSDRVRAVVKKIPKGKTMTYKQVATKAGNPKAARAVGMIMSHNFDSKIPCHRVVRGDGKKSGVISLLRWRLGIACRQSTRTAPRRAAAPSNRHLCCTCSRPVLALLRHAGARGQRPLLGLDRTQRGHRPLGRF